MGTVTLLTPSQSRHNIRISRIILSFKTRHERKIEKNDVTFRKNENINHFSSLEMHKLLKRQKIFTPLIQFRIGIQIEKNYEYS